MEPLSRNKKIGILSLVVLSLTVVGLFGIGEISLSWLKSDILGSSEYTCTEQGQKNNKRAYIRALRGRDNVTNLINLRNSEIVVLENQITFNNTLISQKKDQIEKKFIAASDLKKYISKNCVGTLTSGAKRICKQKQKQLNNIQSDIEMLKDEIDEFGLDISDDQEEIATKKQNINVLEAKLAVHTVFITQYELCDRQLKNVNPLLTSPKMSGEARMSGELLVSGEICMSSEVLISGEVYMSGEAYISSEARMSGEVNAPVYRLAITEEYPGKAVVEQIDYEISRIDSDTLRVTEWFVAEEHTPNILYKCSFLGAENSQLRCLPGTQALVNSETRNYILYARVKGITGVGAFKIYGANIVYNGGKADATNHTTTISIKYGEKPTKTEIQYVSQFGGYGEVDGKMLFPTSLAVDRAGNVYVADVTTSRIQKFDSSGKFLMKFGTRGTGDGQFGHYFNLAIDPLGNVYVSDSANHRIQKFDSSGKFLMKFGTRGTGDGQLQNPSGMFFDKAGNLYVVDSINYRVQKFDSSGKFLMKFTVPGYPDQIVVDREGNMYITEKTSLSIQKFDSSGKFLMKFGTRGTGDGQFNSLSGISLDSSGNIYITDASIQRFQKFDSSGKFLMKFGTRGNSNGQFYDPMGIVIDTEDNIYISDGNNYRVQKFAQVAVCYNGPKTDFELRRLVPGIEFGPIDTDLDKKYFFGTEVCVHGPLSLNDLKKTHPQLRISGFPLKYTIFGANGAIASRESSMGGSVENIKNGQCAGVLIYVQSEEQSFFDKAQRIAFTLDHENIVQEINENNNSKELTIQQKPSITVLSPNGGEKFKSGDTLTIKWNNVGIPSSDSVRIEIGYVHNDFNYTAGRYIQDWIVEKVPNTGSYNWKIPEYYSMGLAVSSFSVRVVANNSVSDDSDEKFSIVQDSEQGDNFVVFTNNSGYYNDDTMSIRWAPDTSEQYGLSLVRKNDPSFVKYILTEQGESGNMTWKIPSDVPQAYDYQIRVTAGLYRSRIGYSSVFAIKPKVSVATCIDSDNTYAVSTGNGGINNTPGLDRYTLGTVKYQSETFTDYCANEIMYTDTVGNNLVRYVGVSSGAYIMEQACLDGKEKYLTTPYKCPNGCSNGACIPPNICPSVCTPLYELSNQCTFNTCGSGCGADDINTFSTLDACKKAQNNTILPIITSLALPATSPTTRVPLAITANKSPVSYLMIDGPTPTGGLMPLLPPKPLANDARWLRVVPTIYNFTGSGSRTLFAWVKDAQGNVSDHRSTIVTITPGVVCPIYPPLPDNWCRGTILPLPKDMNGCDLPPVCLL